MTQPQPSTASVRYHVRYELVSLNEVWDWRAFSTPEEAWQDFRSHPPRVSGSRNATLIKTTIIKTEEEIIDQ